MISLGQCDNHLEFKVFILKKINFAIHVFNPEISKYQRGFIIMQKNSKTKTKNTKCVLADLFYRQREILEEEGERERTIISIATNKHIKLKTKNCSV
jgi:hypothetical protein